MWLTPRLFALPVKAAEKFAKYASFSPTPLSLKTLTSFGKNPTADIIQSTRFLSTELPVRIANILQELHLLPKKLIETPSASLVTSWYEESFMSLIDFESKDLNAKECENFLAFLDKALSKHSTVVETMAAGVMEMHEKHGEDPVTNNQLQYFLDRLFLMRIGIRMLASQHLLVFGPEFNKHHRFVGCIDQHCNVVHILSDAYDDAKLLCDHYYAESPGMEVSLVNDVNGVIEFVYVPSHLYHILFELLKNALRAVVERGRKSISDEYPAIKVLIVSGEHNVTIKLSDQGGGFPRSVNDQLFRYTYTTGGLRTGRSESILSPSAGYAPIAGYGYGLPLSRLYARYLHGDLSLSGAEGYGTDAYVYLMRRAADADEFLPVFNRTSARRYESVGIPIDDWINRNITHETPLQTPSQV
ncbi:Pyruvate dehydrogenase acetyl-transferring kinase mitochondrial [Taenia crassiceps]|uniref:Protein-serine/threonine kinase n=1 Tax=Taenia crassiceps TaxID=6207 RepID=A0ABR4QH00_9CEST